MTILTCYATSIVVIYLNLPASILVYPIISELRKQSRLKKKRKRNCNIHLYLCNITKLFFII